MDEKSALRKTMRQRLAAISADDRRRQEAEIIRALQTVDWSAYHSLYIYRAVPTWHEIPTEDFINWLRHAHPHLKIETTPIDKNAALPSIQYDCIVLPAAAVDQTGNRLGRGAGWYDRLLTSQPDADTIVLVYRQQIVKNLPHATHDQPVGRIIQS